MDFKDWIKISRFLEVDGQQFNQNMMGSTQPGSNSKYEIDDTLYTPDNAELETIKNITSRIAGMFWAFRRNVRENLLDKIFLDAARQQISRGVNPMEDGFPNREIMGIMCHTLRLNIEQCRSLIDAHRQRFRHLADQLGSHQQQQQQQRIAV